ncbi:MAG: starch-binding protein, partial [Eubacterium sp.]
MKTNSKSIVSVIVAIMMIVTMIPVGIVSANAASVGAENGVIKAGDTLYYDFSAAQPNWVNYCGDGWAWVDTGDIPSDFIFRVTLTSDMNFNNPGNQVLCKCAPNWANLATTVPADGQNMVIVAADGQSYTWGVYDPSAVPTTPATTVAPSTDAPTSDPSTDVPSTTVPATTAPSTPSGDGATVYLQNDAGWSTLYCYMWNSSSDENGAWPGQPMTEIGDGVYMYTASKAYKSCIFNGGNGGPQTGDLTTMDGYIYNNSTKEWEVYDTSPLQVRAYTATPSTGIYTESEVVLSASAVNANGAAVSYKFSVTAPDGTISILSDFSSVNSVTWVPLSAGTYTINFDFKDTEGNENSRTSTITVGDDSALVKPIIKSVAPTDLSYIKANAAAQVTVKAGGGNTGTNLLFYKYIVTDPNGKKNIPYYTLNSSYSFTPVVEGTYTVQVYVQGSDNQTANKTYTYVATSGEIPSVPATTAP